MTKEYPTISFFPINLDIISSYKYMCLAVKTPETPWKSGSYETSTDYPAAQRGKIYDIMQIIFDACDSSSG